MKYDYLSRQRYKPRKSWWDGTLTKSDRSKYYQAILNNPSIINGLNLDEKDLYKHTLLEPLSFDMDQYIVYKRIEQNPCILFTFYNPKSDEPTLILIKDINAIQHH